MSPSQYESQKQVKKTYKEQKGEPYVPINTP